MDRLWNILKEKGIPKRITILIATAWAFVQVIDFFAQRYHWPDAIVDISVTLMIALVPFIFILLWFQGTLQKSLKLTLLSMIVVLTTFLSYYEWNNIKREPILIRENLSNPSLMVLPFQIYPDSVKEAYFVDGITSSIITQLTKLNAIPIVSENTSFQYKNIRADLNRIASDNDVKFILQGRVQRVSSSIRITTQLINISTGIQVWAEQFEGDEKDIFRLQDRISRQIAQSLQLKLDPIRERKINSQITTNLKAYDNYLKGKFNSYAMNLDSAIYYYSLAIREDPQFAKAHAELSATYSKKNKFFTDPKVNLTEMAYLEGEKALSLDSTLAEVYYARAYYIYTAKNKFPHQRAILDCKKALAINPSSSNTLSLLGDIYFHVGLFPEAIDAFEKALHADPMNTYARACLPSFPFYEFDYKKVVETYKNVPEIYLKHPAWASERLLAMAFSSQVQAASKEFLKSLKENPSDPLFNAGYALLLAKNGKPLEAMKYLEVVEKTEHNEDQASVFHHATSYMVAAYALMGKKEKAIEWLRWTAEYGFPCYPYFKGDTNLANLQTEPVFQQLMADMKKGWIDYKRLANE